MDQLAQGENASSSCTLSHFWKRWAGSRRLYIYAFIYIWMYIYAYTYIFMSGPLFCTEQTVSGHFSIFKNTFWQFKWRTPSHFHFGPTTAFLFLILYVSPWQCAKQSPEACQSKPPHHGALQTPEGSLWWTLGGSKFQKQEFTLGAGTQEGILLYWRDFRYVVSGPCLAHTECVLVYVIKLCFM